MAALDTLLYNHIANQTEMASSRGICSIVTLIHDENFIAKELALTTIANISENGYYLWIANVRTGAVAALVALLRDGTSAQQSCSLRVIRNVITFKYLELIAAGGVEPLVNLLDSGNAWRQEAAASVLRIVAENGKGSKIIKAGGVPHILALLGSDSMAAQEAATLLRYLTCNNSTKAKVARAGAIPKLILLLDDDDDTVIEAATEMW